MEFVSHRVKRRELKAGDHIYTWRTAYIYSHHGIYVGDDKVVHFTQLQNPNSGESTSICSSSSLPKSYCSTSAGSTSICSSSSIPNSYSSTAADSTSICSSSSAPRLKNLSSSNLTSICTSSSAPGFKNMTCSNLNSSSSSSSAPRIKNLSSCNSTSSSSACLDPAVCGFSKHMSGVVLSCLNCFLEDGSLRCFQYGVSGLSLVCKIRSGICTTAKSDPPTDVIQRAMHLLHYGYGEYDVLSNNCEDFALYCKTGIVVCDQKGCEGSGSVVRSGSGQVTSVAGIPAAFVQSFLTKIFNSNPYVFCATGLGSYNLIRYSNDFGVRNDVSKVAVEEIAALRDNLSANAKDRPKRR